MFVEMFFLKVFSRLLNVIVNNHVATCQQQLMELQELNNSQQLLTAELSDKLEKTEV
jgi:hypothetical protein